ncbi:MAG: hypothetical protein HY960_04480 [Ignavibacteriae bacterium]|nr:hypothetical protein [Ignavibacteriota bacterium]
MKKNKTPISQATTYSEVGEYWGNHDITDVWDKTRAASFEVNIESEVTYFAVEKELTEKVQSFAKAQGVSSGTLVNLWIQQKIQSQSRRKAVR